MVGSITVFSWSMRGPLKMRTWVVPATGSVEGSSLIVEQVGSPKLCILLTYRFVLVSALVALTLNREQVEIRSPKRRKSSGPVLTGGPAH